MKNFDLTTGVVKESTEFSSEWINVAKRVTHDANLVTMNQGSNILTFDYWEGCKNAIYTIQKAHRAEITDLDFNPNKPYALCSVSKDCNLRFWDIRKQQYFSSFEEESHWITGVKYNRFHDQLVLTASSSTYVNLWRVASCSSVSSTWNPLEIAA